MDLAKVGCVSELTQFPIFCKGIFVFVHIESVAVVLIVLTLNLIQQTLLLVF
jgi:hypothetical protein